ncbi:acyl-CoA N-acyltransferase [Paraphoma chrysanthemicola]|uniref:Acyl-CoA N-acyltransferase n=1 Tax=Paraphoma chrysanthemicola TaxID=798071 RepID=A0A8K0W0B1_9PLEO|nr:acyl-CoA N-acyltransferase [Paraphoma chrysanthemicola]
MSEPGAVVIRPREPSDVPNLTQILTNVYNLTKYPVDGPSSFPARFSSPKTLYSFVAIYNDTVAGHAELQPATVLNPIVKQSLASHGAIESFATLVTLFVDPNIQGKGIGARLVEDALAWGRREGMRLALIVLAKDVAAIRMYEKMGWERGVEYFYETKEGVKYRAFSYLAPAG